jgi:tetratricopeptide (TPR) repeat protein
VAAESLDEARQLFLKGKYAEATDVYRTLLEKEPVAAALGLARSQAAVGELKEAVETLTKAVKDHPQEADLHAELARLAFDRGDYKAADEAVAAALKLEKDHLLARWIQAERLRTDGKLKEADAAYHWFVDYYNNHDVEEADDFHWIGLAAAQFARWNRLSDQFTFLVNDLYPDALAADEAYWPAAYETGLLFLEKYNEADAKKEFKAALAINPNAAEVHAALAKLALQNYDLDDARREWERAQELNPKLLASYLCEADGQLANFQPREAIETLEKKVLPLNPMSEETLGRLAAAYGVVDGLGEIKPDSRMGKLIEQATKRNPHCGEFFYSLAAGLDQSRKFPSAAHYYREAVERMPQLVETRGALGLMYMRLGDEVEAKKLLDESFEVDPFNVRVSNSLKVLEVLDNYAVLETEHFVIKFDRGHDEVLARYAARYLEDEVYPALTKQFGFEPKEKSLFEIFHRAKNTSGHGWFSARMVGLPYVGTVGACAGKMVALASPNDMPQKYNWARVLKHEFVHVLNLQQSNFNIPHWYTEALAVQSEGYPRPQSWNEMLMERVPKGKMFNLDTINLGFVRPKSSLDWQMAYCQAQLYAQYMLATYGEDALQKMLEAYADNLETPAALKRSFNVEVKDFEKGYLAYVKKLVAGLTAKTKPAEMTFSELQKAQQAKPDDPDLAARLAQAQLARKQYPEARKLAQDALKKKPGHALATYVMARLRTLTGEDEEAVKLLEGALDREAPEENTLELLAALKLKAEQFAEAAKLYELGAKHNPNDVKWTKALARVYIKSGDNTKLAKALTALADADADDFLVRKKLAQMALEAKNFAEARTWAGRALQVNVEDADVHRMVAEALAAEENLPEAIAEYETSIKLDSKQPAVRFALADIYIRAKQEKKARETLKELLEVSPDYPGAKQLLEALEEEAKK